MSALRHPAFRRLLVGEPVSSFGDSAMFLSLGIWAKSLTGSNTDAGLTMIVGVLDYRLMFGVTAATALACGLAVVLRPAAAPEVVASVADREPEAVPA